MASMTVEVTGGGSLRLVDPESHGAGRTCSVLLLALFLAIPLNAIVVVTVLRSFLRSHVFNLLLASLCAAALLDALLNLTMASVFRGSWTDLYRWVGDSLVWLCRFNTASTQLPMALQVSFLVLLSSHRLAGISASTSTTSPVKGPGRKSYGWLMVLGWVTSFTSVLPMMFGAVDVRFFQERYSCSPVNVTHGAASLATAVSLLCFGHSLPYLILLGMWAVMLNKVLRERQRLLTMELVAMQRAAARSSPVRGLGSSAGFSYSLWDQFWGDGDTAAGQGSRFFVLIGVLTGLQFLLVVPGLISMATTQFCVPSQHHLYHHLLLGNYTHLPPTLQPLHTPWFDGTFTWFRIINLVLVPSLILAVHQPLRTQTCELLRLCRQNKYSQPVQSISGYLRIHNQSRRKRKKSKFQQLFDDKTPVLFASGDGLHLRQAIEALNAAPYYASSFADLSVKQGGENVRRLVYSPERSRGSLRQDVRLLDEEETGRTKKGGKSVRFSQRVSEISERNSFSESVSDVDRATRIDVVPEDVQWTPQGASSRPVSRPFQREEVSLAKEFLNRRGSEPLAAVRAEKQRSLEMELLANGSFASSSSGSLLLPLSQRMRNRES